ncbi:MAG TPA: LPXTG cell wall anchor domain-containing protein, partial [Lachnospiraceae bacterium]
DGDGINNDKESDDDGTTITDKDNDGVADLVDPADKPKEDTDKDSISEETKKNSNKDTSQGGSGKDGNKDSLKENSNGENDKGNTSNTNSSEKYSGKTKTSDKQVNSKTKKAPKTGDVSNVGGLAGLVMLSGSSLLALVGRKRRRLEDDEE